MIWGKSNREKSKRIENKKRTWFAYRPVRLADGRWCWLENIERRYYETWQHGKVIACGHKYYQIKS